MKFSKFTSIEKEKEFYLNPTYVVVVLPYNEEGGTTIVSHYGEFHVDASIEEVVTCFDGLVKFTSLSNDKVFYINPTYVAEIVPSKDGRATIISHQGEFTVGMSIDEASAYLNEGLEKLN